MRALTAATIGLLITGSAFAQQPTTPSTVDPAAPAGQQPKADPKQSSPGATGAMQNQVGSGVATSPQDVQRQQEGKGTAAAPQPGTDKGSAGD